ncbi:hypothetical protein KR054_011500, partial [Drosophila jambulina]
MVKCNKQTKASAKEERKERILKFILENRESKATDTPPSPVKKSPKIKPTLKSTASPKKGDLTSCLITTPSMNPRLAAGGLSWNIILIFSNFLIMFPGENNPVARKPPGKVPRTDSECQFHAPGPKFLAKRTSNFAEQVLVLEPSQPVHKELKNKCDFFPRYVDPAPIKDQTTQTLYRESSAQTLAYLPGAYATEPNPRELFVLPSILPSDKPPGLYEVEVLERSRRRWAFYDAVKLNRKRLQVTPEDLRFEKYKSAIEAFEWEHWMQREEYIQECQMMRLQILIKMFDKREKEMHAASKTRIEKACEGIEKRRQEALRKNEIAYQRGIHKLNNKAQRKWKKESPMEALGIPCSDFYGPQLRYGVDPARRHFHSITGQRAFELRMDDLEKRVIARSMICPFQKLKELSKPKEHLPEAERNIRNEKTLLGFYNSLKYLRETREAKRTTPKCIKLKFKYPTDEEKGSFMAGGWKMGYDNLYDRDDGDREVKRFKKTPMAFPKKPYYEDKPQVILRDLESEAMQNMISSYEATAIGLLMQFLWEETVRLQQQRNLHLISLLAEKERWKREALESGLRQKENDFRMLYEEIFHKSVGINNRVTDQYISSILTDDVDNIAGEEASNTVTELAKQIDIDIERWLESFKLIQNPITFIPLRLMLRDMVSPDLEATLRRHEKFLIAQYIIEDVIFGRVWEKLEPFDISTALTSDFIDRLIDNDLYLFSTESEAESESESPRKTSWYEAHAIIRKLIRQSVPGRRWKEETERNVHEIYNDLFDDIFAEIIFKTENPPPVEPPELHCTAPRQNVNTTKPIETTIPNIPSDLLDSKTSLHFNTQLLSLVKKKT